MFPFDTVLNICAFVAPPVLGLVVRVQKFRFSYIARHSVILKLLSLRS